MFIGHFGVGLGLKRSSPAVSLGTLFLCAQFLDLLWPTFLLAGVEHVEIDPSVKGAPFRFTDYPYSHSLLMAVAWSVLVGLAYFQFRHSRRGAWVCGLAVLSHWLLDLIVHHPDLPLAPWTASRLGLGLWNFPLVTLVVEMAIFAVGTVLYLRTTEAADRTGSIAFWGLIVFLVLIHLGNVFGNPPPGIAAVAWVGQAQWLLVIWAYWIDRHRRGADDSAGQGLPSTSIRE